MPASALYQAMNAVRMPKKPPALMTCGCGAPLGRTRYPMPSSRKVRSRKKNSAKNATVLRSVAIRRSVLKMNQPCYYC
jgi:hypothetical protein